jgi:ferric-dicitrate binding protein FerR (iron transport regulator)
VTDASLKIGQYLHGAIDEAGAIELADWIKADSRHADEFIRHAFVHSHLGITLRGESLLRDLQQAPAIAGSIGNQSPSSPADKRRLHRNRPCRPRLIGLAASLLLAAGVTTALIRHHIEQNRVATVTALVDAQWEGAPLPASTSLNIGSYHLLSGLARIDFSDGSQAILQGPATFAVDRKRLQLASGRVVVSCPTKASRSLVVETSDARIVDLGTEYGVMTGPQSASLVQVFQGSVQVTPKNNAAVAKALKAGDCWSSAAQPVTQSQTAFVREGELEIDTRAAGSAAAAHWADSIRKSVADRSLIFASDLNPLWDGKSIANLAKRDDPWFGALSLGVPLEFVPGRLNDDQALHFSTLRQALRLNIPGRFASLTLAAWIKLDSEPAGSQRHRGILMSDGWGETGQVHWQIKRHGIRLSLFDRGDDEDPRYSATTETLFDGGWHQCVSVIDTSTPANQTVSHYIDGKIIYRRQIPVAIPTLTLGNCCVGNWVPSADDLADDRTLGGSVDDLLIWNRPLRAAEIASLFNAQSVAVK